MTFETERIRSTIILVMSNKMIFLNVMVTHLSQSLLILLHTNIWINDSNKLVANALKYFFDLCVISYRHFSFIQCIRGDGSLSYSLSHAFSRRDISVTDCAKLWHITIFKVLQYRCIFLRSNLRLSIFSNSFLCLWIKFQQLNSWSKWNMMKWCACWLM